jgi:hypothetical protein
MLCKILGSHGGEYEECRLLGCYAYDSCKNRRFGGTLLRSVHRLFVIDNFFSSPILFNLMKKTLRSSETSVVTRAAGHSSNLIDFHKDSYRLIRNIKVWEFL